MGRRGWHQLLRDHGPSGEGVSVDGHTTPESHHSVHPVQNLHPRAELVPKSAPPLCYRAIRYPRARRLCLGDDNVIQRS
eukprot:COSAG02_NODE_25730_length_650_cov_12.648865_1_plen_78_part_01